MKRKTMLLALAMCVAGATTSFAADPQMGTWKLNEAKSKFSAGATKNSTVVYEAAGDKGQDQALRGRYTLLGAQERLP